jgi:hypothetical protein
MQIDCLVIRTRYNGRMKTRTKPKARYSPLEKMIEQLSDCFTSDSAKRLLKMRADPILRKHMEEFADKSSSGTLTPDEYQEYGACVKLDTFVSILKSKLRQRLAREGE